MEREDIKGLSEEEISSRIDSLMQAMKSADPEEIERIRGILRRKVSFFERSAFAAYLLMARTPSAKAERRQRPERAEKSAPRQEKNSTEKSTGTEQESAKAEKVIPEGAKTIYIDVGKMKHLYPKDLSKRLQAELGITRDDIYMIRIHDKYSFVTMSEENCQKAIDKLTGQDINGRIAKVAYSNK